MKKFRIFYALILSTVLLWSCTKSRIIEYPQFESNQKGFIWFGLDRIEITDSSTNLDISLYNSPGNWVSVRPSIKLVGRTTGKIYSLKWMEGLTPDMLIHVDSTGYISAQLIFEPVDALDSSVDLYEDSEILYKGIKLNNDVQDKIKTTLSGSINAIGASWLLVRESNNLPEAKWHIVPVRNGEFRYDIFTDHPLFMEVFIGIEYIEMRIINFPGFRNEVNFPGFWSEGGQINLDFPEGTSENFTINGGPLTMQYQDFEKRRKAFEEGLMLNRPEGQIYQKHREVYTLYVPEFYELKKELRNASIGWKRQKILKRINQLNSSDSVFTKEGLKAYKEFVKFLKTNRDSLSNLRNGFLEKEYSHPTLTNLYKIFQSIKYDEDIDFNLYLFDTYYKDVFIDHPYHKYLREMSSLVAPVKGNHLVNIILPGMNGKLKNLTEIIEGRKALVVIGDFNNNKFLEKLETLKSIYKRNTANTLEIVGIILESDSIPKYNDLIRSKSYPFNILIDNKDKTGAWRKYRLGDNNEKAFIIDENGVISSVNPSIQEILSFQ